MKTRYKNGILLLLLLAFIAFLLRYTSFDDMLTLEGLQAKSQQLKLAVETDYLHSVLVYSFIFILALIFGLPVVGPLTLLGGYLFGVLPATLYAIVCQTIGATTSFLLIRYVFISLMAQRYNKKVDTFKRKMDKYGARYLLILQFMVVFPFFIINMLAALAQVPFTTVLWTTAVGCAPLSFAYALTGKELAKIESVYDIFSVHIILTFVLLILLVCMPMVLKWLRVRMDVLD